MVMGAGMVVMGVECEDGSGMYNGEGGCVYCFLSHIYIFASSFALAHAGFDQAA